MSVYSGDFLGFQLGDIHSERLNITRVSSGNRYSDNLIPSFKDSVVEIPGGDGMYYWDTRFSSRTFQIDFAYDDLRDEDLRQLAKIFSFKGIKPLIFDEAPYKKYMVKCAQAPNLKYICFGNGDTKLYKGEGTVNLIAYYPFGISTEEFNLAYDSSIDGARAYNDGDMDADFQVIYDIHDIPATSSTSNGINITLSNGTDNLKFEDIKNIGTINNQGSFVEDSYLMIDTKTHLVEGLDSNFNKIGNLYNRFITEGDFFKLKVGQNTITSTGTSSSDSRAFESLKYKFLYY